MRAVLRGIVATKKVAVALVTLLGATLVAAGAYVLWARAYPRPALLSHSAPGLDDLRRRVFEWVDAWAAETARASPAADAWVRAGVLEEDLAFYVRHHAYLHQQPAAATWAAKKFNSGGTERDLALRDASERILDRIEVKRDYARVVVAAIDGLRAAAREAQAGARDDDLRTRRAHLMLNTYVDALIKMQDTRRGGGGRGFALHFTLPRTLLEDTARAIFSRRLPEVWRDTTRRARALEGQLPQRYWSLKPFFEALPLRVVRGERATLARDARAASGPIPKSPTRRDFAADDALVVEGFIGALILIPFVLPIVIIGGVFKDLVKLLELVFTILATLIEAITNPIAFLTKLLGALLTLALLVLYLVLGWVLAMVVTPLAFALVVAFNAAQSLVWVVLFAAMVAAALPLWALDLASGGAVSALLRCEAHPEDWAFQPGLADGNRFARAGFLCARPCGDRYTPSLGGLFCQRRKPHEPHWCAHQLIAQAHEGVKPIPPRVLSRGDCAMTQETRAYTLAICLNNKDSRVRGWCDAAFCSSNRQAHAFCLPAQPPPPPPPPPESTLDRMVSALGVTGACALALMLLLTARA
jgi:hypothetical protein